MLELYYDFLDKYFSRQCFELCYMDTDLFCQAMSGDSLDDIVRPEIRQAHEADKKNRLATDKFSKKAPSLFKPGFVGTRGGWLTAKCYLVEDEALNENKYSSKVVSKKNNLHVQCYKDVLDVFLKTRRATEFEEKDIDKAKNVGFRVYDQGAATYEQNKLRLSGYYGKCCFGQWDSYKAVGFLNHPTKMFSINIEKGYEKKKSSTQSVYILYRNHEDCAIASEHIFWRLLLKENMQRILFLY